MAKIKEGEWVRVLDCTTPSYVCQYTKELETIYEGDLDCIEPWKPKEGEWVIPLYKTKDNFCIMKWKKEYEGTSYDFCEPFKGELPVGLKDQS
jgi:hypothetical protein